MGSTIRQVSQRLGPQEDLRKAIGAMVVEHEIRAGVVVSAVGSLGTAVLRMAGGAEVQSWDEDFEIVSITGTVGIEGSHIHIALSGANGGVIGGHLKDGCIVRTTAEVVLLAFDDVQYRRIADPDTDYDELRVE